MNNFSAVSLPLSLSLLFSCSLSPSRSLPLCLSFFLFQSHSLLTSFHCQILHGRRSPPWSPCVCCRGFYGLIPNANITLANRNSNNLFTSLLEALQSGGGLGWGGVYIYILHHACGRRILVLNSPERQQHKTHTEGLLSHKTWKKKNLAGIT